jgi:hypothetical protein
MFEDVIRRMDAAKAELFRRILKMFGTEEPPEDPYAYVGAPKRPRLPQRSASVAEPLD